MFLPISVAVVDRGLRLEELASSSAIVREILSRSDDETDDLE